MVRNTVELRVGRLLELRIAAGYETTADVDAVVTEMTKCQGAVSGPCVTLADLRACKVLSTSAAEYLLSKFRSVNARTERSALLHTHDSPTAIMQYMRISKEAGHPQRRVFTDSQELVRWLGEALTPAELTRAREFLGLPQSDSTPRAG